jgi:hypothetical protein
MSSGFGTGRKYKLVVTAAVGGSTEIRMGAKDHRQALKQATAIMNAIANPGIDYGNRLGLLGLAAYVDLLFELGQQLKEAAASADIHPDFVAKISKRSALIERRGQTVIDQKLQREVMDEIKSHHFLAILYAPNGGGLKMYSNLTSLIESGWEVSA